MRSDEPYSTVSKCTAKSSPLRNRELNGAALCIIQFHQTGAKCCSEPDPHGWPFAPSVLKSCVLRLQLLDEPRTRLQVKRVFDIQCALWSELRALLCCGCRSNASGRDLGHRYHAPCAAVAESACATSASIMPGSLILIMIAPTPHPRAFNDAAASYPRKCVFDLLQAPQRPKTA